MHLDDALTLWRKFSAFDSYRSRHMEILIASYSYRSGLIGNVIAFYSYRSENMTKAITCNAVTFWSNVADLCIYTKKANFRLFAANGKWKWKISICLLQTEMEKRKIVFLGRQTTNVNRLLLFQQTCPSKVITLLKCAMISVSSRRLYSTHSSTDICTAGTRN
jgi:hypothetical protein